ncbi:hypothetical protein PHLGIDRAFT_125488 [Phlebiopsis gigantea 11061_1 CR5-6]|uniref:Lytic polysaccharide monooxygenase n=1 Tax=Phlebiopsis gigantea (strain 11061_1 CR5-6) TaxID=745531 RepID=A0A0C3SEE6_PHLG1|nr:hypothetical protein PHLGIDRAFT_125488 [Phlebiopsis gigantea 11061_1 CR5-6]
MLGFNVTTQSFSYDNRPVVPLYNMPFSQWWFHGHLGYPPHDNDIVEFPAGGSTNLQISCDKGYTDYYASAPGGDIRDKNSDLTCPGQPTSAIHANDASDAAGCALGIAYKSDFNDVQPEDFVIFSVIHTCPWYLNNNFQVPADMPACPNGKCICGFFWIHNPDSGGEQMYMNGFQCSITGNTGNKPIGKPGLPRQCGADSASGHEASPSNCTVGPKNPFYWDQTERNNMFEGLYDAPTYSQRYDFPDGAQPNLFQDATIGGTPASSPSPSPANANAAPSVSPSPAAASSSPAAVSPSPAAASPSPAAASSSPAAASPSPAAASSSSAPAPASSSSSTAAASSTRKCKANPGGSRKKRNAVKRHLKNRLAHDAHDSL